MCLEKSCLDFHPILELCTVKRKKKKPLILKSGLPGEGSLGTNPRVHRGKQGSEGEEMNAVSLPASCVTKQESSTL